MAERDDLVEAWTRMRALVLDNDVRAQVAEALGMTFVKSKTLRRLLTVGPVPMRDLAGHLGTDKPYVTLIVDQLEEMGMVTRTVSPEDRRQRIVALTDAGRAAAQQADAMLNQPPAALAELSAEDLATLAGVLRKLP